MSNRILATLVAFFLGGIGGEWLVLRKPVNFVLSLLFFWTTIPCWIAFYHIIVFLMMSDEKFEKKYQLDTK